MLLDRGDSQLGRRTAAAGYRVADLASDLVAVMEAAGFERFSVFGYSFTGAFAPWLAHLTGRVDAVVSGGFPIAGDYSPLYPEIQLFAFWGEDDEEIARGGGVRAARRRAGPSRAQARVLPRSRPRGHAGPHQ